MKKLFFILCLTTFSTQAWFWNSHQKPTQEPSTKIQQDLLEELTAPEMGEDGLQKQFTPRHYSEVADTYDEPTIKEILDNCPQDLLTIINSLEYLAGQPLPAWHPMRKAIINKVLLVGPPGSGKSSLSLVIALKCRRPYIFISASSLANEYKNSSVRIINELFLPLINAQRPVVIILDEITAFTNRFNNKNDSDPGAVEHLWFMLDRCENNPNILIVGTANSTDKIPDTIKDRFSGAQFYIPHPDTNARLRLLNQHVKKFMTGNTDILARIAQETDEYSLREIMMVVKLAKNKSFAKQIKNAMHTNELHITNQNLESALESIVADHNNRMYEKKKEYYKQVWDVVSPHMIPILSVAISTWFQFYTHKKNMQMQEQHHEDNMAMAREHFWMQAEQGEIHYEEQKEINEMHHQESMSQSNKHHKENLDQSNWWSFAGWGTTATGIGVGLAIPIIGVPATIIAGVSVAAGVVAGKEYITKKDVDGICYCVKYFAKKNLMRYFAENFIKKETH